MRPARAPGLRERKKAQTRAAIQRHALGLFRENGYSGTTMEQIAAASEVSPSTLYRYFPTKEDLVLTDDYDPVMASAVRAQPPQLSPLEALQEGIRSVMETFSPEEFDEFRERSALSFNTPEVRAKALDHLVTTMDLIAELIAERAGRSSNDYAVRVMAGTVIGGTLAAQLRWIDALDDVNLGELIDQALEQVIAGAKLLDFGSAR